MKSLDFLHNKLLALAVGLTTIPFFLPFRAFAQNNSINLTPCDDTVSGGFNNLCFTNTNQAGEIVRNAIIGILVIVAVVSLVFLIWGGFKWVTSGGDKAKVESARGTIIAAIVGLIIAFLAYFILTIVLGLFGLKLSDLSIPNIIPVSSGSNQ